MRANLWTCAVLSGLMLTGGCDAMKGDGGPSEATIVASRAGEARRINTPRRAVLLSDDEVANFPIPNLAALKRQGGPDSVVAVIALGRKPTAGYAVRITGVRVMEGTLHLRAVITEPKPGQAIAQVLTYPYHAAAMVTPPFSDVRWTVTRRAM